MTWLLAVALQLFAMARVTCRSYSRTGPVGVTGALQILRTVLVNVPPERVRTPELLMAIVAAKGS